MRVSGRGGAAFPSLVLLLALGASGFAGECRDEFDRGRLPSDRYERIRHYSNAIRACTAPDDRETLAAAYWNRAVNYQATGQLGDAESDLEMVIQYDAGGTMRRDAQEALAQLRSGGAGAAAGGSGGAGGSDGGISPGRFSRINRSRRHIPRQASPQAPPPEENGAKTAADLRIRFIDIMLQKRIPEVSQKAGWILELREIEGNFPEFGERTQRLIQVLQALPDPQPSPADPAQDAAAPALMRSPQPGPDSGKAAPAAPPAGRPEEPLTPSALQFKSHAKPATELPDWAGEWLLALPAVIVVLYLLYLKSQKSTRPPERNRDDSWH